MNISSIMLVIAFKNFKITFVARPCNCIVFKRFFYGTVRFVFVQTIVELALVFQLEKFWKITTNLLELLGKRMKVADEIGQVKKDNNVAVLQSSRWNEIQEKMVAEGAKKGLTEEFIIKLFKDIHQESIGHQEKVLNS